MSDDKLDIIHRSIKRLHLQVKRLRSSVHQVHKRLEGVRSVPKNCPNCLSSDIRKVLSPTGENWNCLDCDKDWEA